MLALCVMAFGLLFAYQQLHQPTQAAIVSFAQSQAGTQHAQDLTFARTSAPHENKTANHRIEPQADFGWQGFIARPLYWALRWLYEHGVANWGWDIILLTGIFNLLMFWPRILSMKSSLKMMRIQPRIDEVKKRYAHLSLNDPKRVDMSSEMMALYKSEGANMYGGCLPLLVQMPLLFAYAKVLQNAVELHHAHWLWLTDLASPDPLHILPILIIVTMFATQCITPSPGMSPTQRRMLAVITPVIMGFTLLRYASGLALYWATGNLINFAIQLMINRSKMGKEMHAIAARRAEERA